ncbi:MAG: NAD(P)/FAD-dependent oxidoreductase [Lysobacterales bacterium]
MSASLAIAIVGYGTAGQALGIALGRAGHSIDIYEQAAQPGPVGAGFLLQPTGMAALWQLGLLEAAWGLGARIERLYGENPAGRVVMDMRYADLGAHYCGLGMQRGALFQLLHAAQPAGVRIHAGRRIEQVDSARGYLVDAGGRREGPFDLVVAADGAASALRPLLGRTRLDRPYPWGALWCLLPLGAWPWPQELRQRYRLARQMLGLLPVGTRPDDPQPRMSFFWSLHGDAFESWATQPLAAWHAELSALWPAITPHLGGLSSHAVLARARYRDVLLDLPWHRDRLVLLGDAAHAMSPQLGQGVNMALLDALTLAETLETPGTLAERLDAYARQRTEHIRAYRSFSRWLTPLFQSEADALARLRDLCFAPLSRLPGGRAQSLAILTGTRSGWFGRWPLPEGYLEALAALTRARTPASAAPVA